MCQRSRLVQGPNGTSGRIFLKLMLFDERLHSQMHAPSDRLYKPL